MVENVFMFVNRYFIINKNNNKQDNNDNLENNAINNWIWHEKLVTLLCH